MDVFNLSVLVCVKYFPRLSGVFHTTRSPSKKLPDNSQTFKRFFFRLTSQVLSGGNNSLARAGELSPNTKVKLSDQKSVTDSSAFQELGHPELDKSPALWFSCFEISILALPTCLFLPWHSCQRHSFCCNPGQFFLGVCIYLHTGQGTCFLDAGHLSVL